VTRREYRTSGGRVVLGGGGIVPDVVVRPDTLTEIEREFFVAASKAGPTFADVAFRFAVDYARQNPQLRLDFPITQQMREEFFRRLVDAGVEVTREQFQGAQRLLDQRLGNEIALTKFGQAAAAQRNNRNDPVVRAAVDLLRGAPDQAALFSRANAGAQTTARR
jgi:carboxyl-terminal processing protease